MTREQFAMKIRWQTIIWAVGIVNVIAMLPQLVRIIRTHAIQGLSLEMFLVYFLIQIAFSFEGFFTRNRMLMVCMALSAIVSATVIGFVIWIRHFGG